MRAAAESAVVRLENVAKRYGAGAQILLAPGAFHFRTGGIAAGATPVAMTTARVALLRRLARLP